MKNHKHIAAFSLVELSIVLVIAGLTAAAVTGGAHLMQAAKLNKTISEITGYATAINNFKDKYRAWPGDMSNATSYWGTYNSSTNPNGTVNGNGDEKISGDLTESLRAWQQMFLAGMIGGNYSGVSAGAPDYAAGTNLPAATGIAQKGSHYYITYFSNYFTTYGNVLQLGSNQDNTNPWGGALSPADAYLIDVKLDKQSSISAASAGNIYAIRSENYSSAGYCVDAAYSSASANYILTDTTETSCRLVYWLSKL